MHEIDHKFVEIDIQTIRQDLYNILDNIDEEEDNMLMLLNDLYLYMLQILLNECKNIVQQFYPILEEYLYLYHRI